MTASAFGWPVAVSLVPSMGSTATSTPGPSPLPTSSPLKSMGASSFSPSPITTVPCMETLSIISRIASTAAASAAILSPPPIHRPDASAAASVTRTSSIARLRSGRSAFTWTPPGSSERPARDRGETSSYVPGPRSPDQALLHVPLERAPKRLREGRVVQTELAGRARAVVTMAVPQGACELGAYGNVAAEELRSEVADRPRDRGDRGRDPQEIGRAQG